MLNGPRAEQEILVKLSDIMGHMGMAGYAEVALAIFLVVFICATIWAYLPSNSHRFSVAINMPLEDGAAVTSMGCAASREGAGAESEP